MAHLREICVRPCHCGAKAKVELINAQNAATGTFCRRHGAQALKKAKEDEKTWWEAMKPRAE